MAGAFYEQHSNIELKCEFGSNVKLIKTNNAIKELQTIIRDKIVVEEGLNLLPYSPLTVDTPTAYQKGSCGVSIMRSGESMEKGLRDCCQSIRIGKILIQSDNKTNEAKVLFARFPEDIQFRRVLLMYPIISSGNTMIQAIQILKENNVKETNIIVLNLFCTPNSIQTIASKFPLVTILTSEIHVLAPTHFGKKYYGID